MANALQSLPGWLIDATLQGTLAILVVWLIIPWVRRGLGAQAAYILWGLVLLRLLLPWQPASPFHWGISLPEIREVDASALRISVTTEESEPAPTVARAPVAQKIQLPVALLVWLAGVWLIVGFSMVRSLRAARLAGRAREISGDPRLVRVRESLPPMRVQIRETGELRSPALTGLWRPVILLPLDWRERLNDEQLRCVLAHEAGHHRRRDLLWRWTFLIARALHWFNPLVWLAERAARTDQEMACDEWVLRHDRTASAECYGEALLVSAQRLGGGARFGFSVQADMAESRVGLRRRIMHLARIRPRGWRALAAGVLLTGFLLMVTGPARSVTPPVEEPAEPSAVAQAKVPDVAPAEPAQENKAKPPANGSNVLIEVKILEIPPELISSSLGADKSQEGTIAVRAIYHNDEFQRFLHGLNDKEGVELMSAPSVTTRSGQRSTIQIVREFRYPTEFEQAGADSLKAGVRIPPTPTAFETKPIGVTLECEPTVRKDGTIDLTISSRVVEFEGFMDFAGSRAAKSDLKKDPLVDTYQPAEEGGAIKQPIFASREMTNKIAVRSGETAVLGGITSNFRKVADTLEASSAKEPEVKRVLFIFMTATAVRADGQKRGASASQTTPGRNGERFYAVPAPDKPGYVTSPYAPEAGYIDVRGFEAGTEVKDPYTGQILLVPGANGKEPDPKSPLSKAARITIPSVEFKNLTIVEAMNLLKSKGVEFDPEPEANRRGVNLVLKMAPDRSFDDTHRISATLTNVSLLDALKRVAAAGGLSVEDEKYAVALAPENPQLLSTRVYRVPRTFLPDLQKADSKAVQEYWKTRGIGFPEGATVSFLPPARLVLRNTMDEHTKVGTLFLAQQDEDGVRPRFLEANAEDPEMNPARPTPTPRAKDFKIEKVEAREAAKGAKTFTVTMRHLGQRAPKAGELNVVAYFYESSKKGNIDNLVSNSSPQWLTPPTDWKDGEKAVFEYKPSSVGKQYAGCVVAVFYRGEMQDRWGSSEELLSHFPSVPK